MVIHSIVPASRDPSPVGTLRGAKSKIGVQPIIFRQLGTKLLHIFARVIAGGEYVSRSKPGPTMRALDFEYSIR